MTESRYPRTIWLLGAVVAGRLLVLMLARTSPVAQARDKDCSDFKTQKKAQRWFNHHHPRRDPANLDSDNDRIPCESNRCPCSRRWHRQHGKVAAKEESTEQAGTAASVAKRGRFYKRCGSQRRLGAGWYHVRAHNLNCREARHVARRFWRSGDKHFEGWSCHTYRVGEELRKARCHRQAPHRFQRVRFEFGA